MPLRFRLTLLLAASAPLSARVSASAADAEHRGEAIVRRFSADLPISTIYTRQRFRQGGILPASRPVFVLKRQQVAPSWNSCKGQQICSSHQFFSKVAHQWVHKAKRESIIFVMYVLKTDCEAQARTHLENTLGKSKKEANAILNNDNSSDCCTGFIIGNHGRKAQVLTCCHSLKEFYSAEEQLTKELVAWFEIFVMCIHQEERLASSDSSLYDDANYPRIYTTATALKVDGNKDLMLLEINMNQLYHSPGIRCQKPHVPLKLAKSISPQLSDVVMVSWPPLLPDTVVTGELTSTSRCYNQISKETNKGYNMSLIELNMIGREGCSGSPILNHEGEVVAVYHGRLHDKGYAVSFRDVSEFLGPATRQMLGFT